MKGHTSTAARIKVTHGSPTPEELAILTAVLLIRTTAITAAAVLPVGTTWHPDIFRAPHSWHHHT